MGGGSDVFTGYYAGLKRNDGVYKDTMSSSRYPTLTTSDTWLSATQENNDTTARRILYTASKNTTSVKRSANIYLKYNNVLTDNYITITLDGKVELKKWWLETSLVKNVFDDKSIIYNVLTYIKSDNNEFTADMFLSWDITRFIKEGCGVNIKYYKKIGENTYESTPSNDDYFINIQTPWDVISVSNINLLFVVTSLRGSYGNGKYEIYKFDDAMLNAFCAVFTETYYEYPDWKFDGYRITLPDSPIIVNESTEVPLTYDVVFYMSGALVSSNNLITFAFNIKGKKPPTASNITFNITLKDIYVSIATYNASNTATVGLLYFANNITQTTKIIENVTINSTIAISENSPNISTFIAYGEISNAYSFKNGHVHGFTSGSYVSNVPSGTGINLVGSNSTNINLTIQ